MTDGIDTTLLALQRIAVYFTTDRPDQPNRVDAQWERTADGYGVHATFDGEERSALIADPDEIEFAAHSGADLYLRVWTGTESRIGPGKQFRQYGIGMHGKWEMQHFLVDGWQDHVPRSMWCKEPRGQA